MNKLLLTFCLALLTVAANANPITPSQAKKKAEKTLRAIRKADIDVVPVSMPAEVNSRIQGDATEDAYYIFNAKDGQGFAIVAADDNMPAILAYSDTGEFPSDGDMPDGLIGFLEFCSEYQADVRKGVAPAVRLADEEATVIVAPLLTSKWGQDAPYNYYCPTPKGGQGNCPVGCVATAMAQIMYKWQWPATGKGAVSYDSSAGTLEVDFTQSTYQWDLLQDNYPTLFKNETKRAAIAKLCYDCGVASRMQYRAGSSGTHDQYAIRAYYTNFSYKASTIDLLYRDCFATQEEWNNIIKRELRAGRPFQFSASSASGSGRDAGGHSYVVDGYDSNDFVHVNWGWDGRYNAYYAIHVMDGGNYQFSEDQSIVIGIQPNFEGIEEKPRQHRLYLDSLISTKATSVDLDGTFAVEVGGFYNMSPYANRFTIGIGLYDLNGNLLENVFDTENTKNEYVTMNYPAWSGFSYYGNMYCKLSGKKYPDGDYYLRFICLQDSYDTFILPDAKGGSEQTNLIHAYIHGGKMYFNQVSTGIASVQADAQVQDVKRFGVDGKALGTAQHNGIVIEQQQMSDGTVRSVKRIMK
ncbi:MAG: C10 family peptidase [Bacteroidaceae bacterium]|nr:C10 family peptidase [Bacteroidaceae bacterium]